MTPKKIKGILPGIICDVKHTMLDNDRAKYCATYAVLNYIMEKGNENLNIAGAAHYIIDLTNILKTKPGYDGDVYKTRRTAKAFSMYMEDHKVKTDNLDFGEMETIYRSTYFDDSFIYPDVKKALPKLRQICRLGINTCCDKESGELLKNLPTIKQHFGDRITMSGETGIWTKDAKSISDTLEKMGTDPKITIMVGDILADFLGANELEMPTVLIKRHPLTEVRKIYNEPGYEITRFDELIPIARKIASQSRLY